MSDAQGSTRPRVLPFGDCAVMIDLGRPPSPSTSRLVHDLAAVLARAGADGRFSGGQVPEPPVPAATTILVPVDPVDPGVAAATARIEALVGDWRPDAAGSTTAGPERLEIPVAYGGATGPDLGAVAGLAGLSPEAVIAAHTGTEYEVEFLGFAPGFAYLGPLPPELVLPRRPTPRLRVPGGSVAIGGPQTAVYPGDGPGGWWLIGRTSLRIWDPARDPAALLRPGMRVRFQPVVVGDPDQRS